MSDVDMAWDGVLFDPDIGPGVHARLNIKPLLALGGTCKAAPGAITEQFARLAWAALATAGYGKLCRYAAAIGNLRLLKWARARGCLWNGDGIEAVIENSRIYETMLETAASKGHLHLLKYAHENGCPSELCASTCSEAAFAGHLDCLQYLHEQGFPWDEETCRFAATRGHLDCLKYAHEHGCAWNTRTCEAAADEGDLDSLQYAHKNGCPWDTRTCEAAAGLYGGGSLACLQYARENGCPWDKQACRAAAATPDPERFWHHPGQLSAQELREIVKWIDRQ